MNEMAHIVHDLVTGNAKFEADLLSHLSQQERAALEDLETFLHKSPSELAALLVQDGPTTVWFCIGPVADHRIRS